MKTRNALGWISGRNPHEGFRWVILAGICWAALAVTQNGRLIGADDGVTDAPGFRPKIEGGGGRAFIAALPEASLAVLPCVVRSPDGLKHERGLAEAIAGKLRDAKIAAQVGVGDATVDLPEVSGDQPQFTAFQAELAALSGNARLGDASADYVVLVEFLVTPRRRGGEAVGGIHCFVVTRDGRNAFSFLLNSHHRIFVDAQLRTDASGEAARAALTAKAAAVVAEALIRQITAARTANSG